jgi:hypothetical protein
MSAVSFRNWSRVCEVVHSSEKNCKQGVEKVSGTGIEPGDAENLTLKQLSLLRTEMQEGFTLINNKIGALAEGMITMRRRALS